MKLSNILLSFTVLLSLLKEGCGAERRALRLKKASRMERAAARRMRRLYDDSKSEQYYSYDSADEMVIYSSAAMGGSASGKGGSASGKGGSASGQGGSASSQRGSGPCGKGGKGKGGKGGSGEGGSASAMSGSAGGSGKGGSGKGGSASAMGGSAGKGGSGKGGSGGSGKGGRRAHRDRDLASCGPETTVEEIQGEIIELQEEIIDKEEELIEQATSPTPPSKSMYSPSNDDRRRHH